ncbi:MerR family transcriptional regulator [Paenibacillus sacheonensis]|uniref:MerR family transcriptional regulator n=1 Tax=Paenibacillus sacheonensis TaxID=742054 RepID=A0A7X5C2D6_9BACL|nr:MerR family transcriptional regulator [Paenibacillus sacheonensis]MBM7564978.1 DNA-binding transcriptional MerR regulator [Paenibacillus sacheonensis]NBC70234.1 MerR family transcriptional regulator [Paenibacillus sacheonensis]
MEITYAIADISAETGLSIDVIRYYERIGLLPAVKRKENGHRAYSKSDLARFTFVTHLKRTQMPLKEIEQYIRYYNEGNIEACYRVLHEHKGSIERQIAELTDSLGILNYKLDNYQQLIQPQE